VAAYVIADIEVLDFAKFQEYLQAIPAIQEQCGGRFLVRGGTAQVLEQGLQPYRVVLLEFPTVQQAQDWWNSPAYAAIKPIRHASARSHLNILVEGVQ
jgi:uncharacterized protein (DUF1330 family)